MVYRPRRGRRPNTNQGSGSVRRPRPAGHAHHGRRPNTNQGSGSIGRPRAGGLVGAVGAPRMGLPTPTAPAPAPAPVAPVTAPAPAPAGPQGQHFVPDAAYNSATDFITRDTEHTLSQLNDQERKTKFEYGIDDPTNPNSRAALMKQMYLNRTAGTSASLAAGGHLYSGARLNALGSVQRHQETDTAALRASYDEALGKIGEARTQAKFGAEDRRNQAFQDWLGRQGDAEVPLDEGGDGDVPEPAPAPANATPAQKAHAASQKSRAAALRARRAAVRAARKQAQHAHPGRRPNTNQGSGRIPPAHGHRGRH